MVRATPQTKQRPCPWDRTRYHTSTSVLMAGVWPKRRYLLRWIPWTNLGEPLRTLSLTQVRAEIKSWLEDTDPVLAHASERTFSACLDLLPKMWLSANKRQPLSVASLADEALPLSKKNCTWLHTFLMRPSALHTLSNPEAESENENWNFQCPSHCLESFSSKIHYDHVQPM